MPSEQPLENMSNSVLVSVLASSSLQMFGISSELLQSMYYFSTFYRLLRTRFLSVSVAVYKRVHLCVLSHILQQSLTLVYLLKEVWD